jgi:hypothetical protein
MHSFLRSLAILSAVALPVAAHATTYSANITLTDNTSNDITFTLLGGSPANFTASPYVDVLTIQESSTLLPASSSLNETDNLVLGINFTAPATGSGSLSGTGTISGKVNKADGSILWNNTSTTIVLTDGTQILATISPDTVTFTPDSNVKSNSPHTVTAEDDLTFTVQSAATPEPSSIALLGTGVLSVAGLVRRRFSV